MTSSQVLTLPPPSAISRTVQTQGQKGKVRTHAEPLSSAIGALCVHNVTPALLGSGKTLLWECPEIPSPPAHLNIMICWSIFYTTSTVSLLRQIDVNSVTFWAVQCTIISLHMEAMLRLKFTKYEESNLSGGFVLDGLFVYFPTKHWWPIRESLFIYIRPHKIQPEKKARMWRTVSNRSWHKKRK